MQIIENSIIGTRSAVLRLRRRGSSLEFVVFPMLHVAMPSFYDEVARRLRECDLLVVEGIIGDSAGVSALTLTYRAIPANESSGLIEDNIPYRDLGVPLITPDFTAEELDAGIRALPLKTRLLMWGVTPFVAATQYFSGRRHLLSPDVEINDLPTAADELAADDDDVEAFLGLLIGRRDERVLTALAEIHTARSSEVLSVAIVYGAGHVPGIVTGLSKLGYRVASADWITVVDA